MKESVMMLVALSLKGSALQLGIAESICVEQLFSIRQERFLAQLQRRLLFLLIFLALRPQH
jgi:hypothetical protein